MMTPEQVHYGRAEIVRRRRDVVPAKAFLAHPERFVKGRPAAKAIPTSV